MVTYCVLLHLIASYCAASRAPLSAWCRLHAPIAPLFRRIAPIAPLFRALAALQVDFLRPPPPIAPYCVCRVAGGRPRRRRRLARRGPLGGGGGRGVRRLGSAGLLRRVAADAAYCRNCGCRELRRIAARWLKPVAVYCGLIAV